MIKKIMNVGNDQFYVTISTQVNDNRTDTIDIVGDLTTVSQQLLNACNGDKEAVKDLCFSAANPILVWSEGANGLVEAKKLHPNHLHNTVNSYIRKLMDRTIAARKTTDYVRVSEDVLSLTVLASRFVI